ncbi:MAG TPA: OmpH family outer membrane protein [Thermohalobaculum sp.]|nr:OmpH family outer membrane protein [Thermohalobaculum sp.]
MGTNAPTPTLWTRRMAIALAVLPLLSLPGFDPGLGFSLAKADQTAILMISRKRLLNDTEHARTLLRAEIELTAELQRRIDAIKVELTDEEQELARLRPTLDRTEFADRVAKFDRRLKSQRHDAQKYAANLQSVFRAERLKLSEALKPLLAQVLEAHGAAAILDTDQLLASDPALDVTDEAIARFNATVPLPAIPNLEAIGPDISSGPNGEPAAQ